MDGWIIWLPYKMCWLDYQEHSFCCKNTSNIPVSAEPKTILFDVTNILHWGKILLMLILHHISVCERKSKITKVIPPAPLLFWRYEIHSVWILVCLCLHVKKKSRALMLLDSGIGSTFYLRVTPSQIFFASLFSVSTSLQLLTFVVCCLHFAFSFSFCFPCSSLPHVILSHSCACHHILKIEGQGISYIISTLLATQQCTDTLD